MVEEESAACNYIANCNCSVYSYHSVARFESALYQKHCVGCQSRGGRIRRPSLLVFLMTVKSKRSSCEQIMC